MVVSTRSCSELLKTLELCLSLGKVGCEGTVWLYTTNTTIYAETLRQKSEDKIVILTNPPARIST
jgi:hypothetical protein